MDTYSEIYERMKVKYEEESGYEIDDASDIAIRLKVLAGEIYNAQTSLEWLKRQMFAATASGEYLDHLASQRGLERKAATKAQGSIVFSLSAPTDYDLKIPKGSVVATEDETPLMFYTTEDGYIHAHTTAETIPAEAELAGYSGNILRNKAVVPISVPSGVSSVRNSAVFKGGTDTESDIALRKRVAASYTSRPNGFNSAYYEQLALSVDGVYKAGVIAKVRGTGTINVYVGGNGENVSDSILENVQKLLDEKRELTTDVLAKKASFVNTDFKLSVIAKSGYEESEIVEKCKTAISDYLNSIPMGETMYLSGAGKSLLETGCIENYAFDVFMYDVNVAGSQCHKAGTIDIEVI